MQEHFLNYEQSLAVKKLGFDEPCLSYYEGESFSDHLVKIKNDKEDDEDSWYVTTSPLKTQFFKWVRDNGIECTIVPMILDGYKEYQFVIFLPDEIVETGFETYEQAEEACIDKIIEILNNITCTQE